MEIFRTDGGGKSVTDERLSNLLVEFCKLEPNLLKKIISIRDHKGTLMIEIEQSDFSVIDLVFYLFSYLWIKENEYLVQIYINDICVEGYDKGCRYYGR